MSGISKRVIKELDSQRRISSPDSGDQFHPGLTSLQSIKLAGINKAVFAADQIILKELKRLPLSPRFQHTPLCHNNGILLPYLIDKNHKKVILNCLTGSFGRTQN